MREPNSAVIESTNSEVGIFHTKTDVVRDVGYNFVKLVRRRLAKEVLPTLCLDCREVVFERKLGGHEVAALETFVQRVEREAERLHNLVVFLGSVRHLDARNEVADIQFVQVLCEGERDLCLVQRGPQRAVLLF